MNNYEKLVSFIEKKLNFSEEFLNLSTKLKNSVDNYNFDDVTSILDNRKELIKNIDGIDGEFVALYEALSKSDDFSNELKKYPQLSENIIKIRQNFQKVQNIDAEIMPFIDAEYKQIQSELKEHNNKAKVTNKYGQDSIDRMTINNYGIFFDEKK
ncbi:hypothetical protein [Criibacterium bergeronii]|uniref:Flagellar protein FliT n=1 Tax=Criibacterium bergeronii TaxID=1871336 RepID=A0A371IN35_9FIRM|nr:hypothetical protein [Criibacterium bergeronii]RDY21903.1 hypothetical protein BBG48_002185 [Criibacterium bergeronii]